MARCGCSGSCSCLIESGPGIQVDGIGSVENPYVVSADAAELVGRIEFEDTNTVDFVVTGVGTPGSPLAVRANALVSMEELTDVQGAPTNGQVMVWVDDHWEPQAQSGSGTGLPPGGTTGQVLTKVSDTDGDANWQAPTGGGGVAPITADYCVLRTTVAQTMAPSTEVSMIFQGAASVDPTGMWDGSTLVTIQKAGVYRVTAWTSFAYNATGNKIGLLRVNGTTNRQWYVAQGGNGATTSTVTQDFDLKAGDTIQFRQYQSTGANLDTVPGSYGPGLAVVRIGGGGIASERVYSSNWGRSGAFSVPNNAHTIIPLDVELTTDGIAYVTDHFVIPVDGWYQLDGCVCFAANATGVRVGSIFVNGTSVASAQAIPGAAGSVSAPVAIARKLKAGDVVDLRGFQNSTAALAIAGATYNTFLTVTKVPETIPATGIVGERIMAASRSTAAAQSIPNNAATKVNLDTLTTSDGVAWDTTNQGFVIPSTGWFDVNCAFQFVANATGYRVAYIQVNGVSQAASAESANSTAAGQSVQASKQLYLNAGDLITFLVYQNSGAALALVNNAMYNFASIVKVPSVFPQSVALGERTYAIAYRQTSGQSFASGGNGDPVLWDALDYSEGGIAYDGAGRFTVPVAGYYQVNCKVNWPGNATGRRRIRIGLDGSSGVPGIVTDPGPVNATDGYVQGFSRMLKCNAGSQIIVGVDHTAGVALAVGSYTSVDITKVPAPAVAGSAASGVWGSGPLAVYGSDTLQGRPVYVDSNGQLRAEPAGVWVDCSAEVRWCSDVSTAANAGQTVSAKYCKIGKMVTFVFSGIVGTGAVANFAMLLPPSAGVPAGGATIVGGPPGLIGTVGQDVIGGSRIVSNDRICFVTQTNAFTDSLANWQVRHMMIYEVL